MERMQPKKITDHEARPLLIPSEASQQKRVQPVKIAQLLRLSTRKTSERKSFRQPVRVAQFFEEARPQRTMEENSTQKRMEPERLLHDRTTSKDKKTMGRKNDGSHQLQLVPIDKSARRNLNFNESFTTPWNKFPGGQQTVEAKFKGDGRTGFILPPNSIKNKYIYDNVIKTDRTSNRKMNTDPLPIDNTKITWNAQAQNMSRISEEIVRSFQSASAGSVIKHTSSLCRKSVHESFETLNTIAPKIVLSSPQSLSAKRSLSTSDLPLATTSLSKDSVDSFFDVPNHELRHNDFQSIPFVETAGMVTSEECTEEIVCVKKKDLLRFQSALMEHMSIVNAQMEATLRHIREILSSSTSATARTPCKMNEQNLPPNRLPITAKEKDSVPCCISPRRETEIAREFRWWSAGYRSPIVIGDPEKENNQDADASMDLGRNDSFLRLETALNITHSKVTPVSQIGKLATPLDGRWPSEKAERPVREYMLLKSNLNFLETPESKGFRSLREQSSISRRRLSRKVLLDLRNLYSETMDT